MIVETFYMIDLKCMRLYKRRADRKQMKKIVPI